MFITLDSFATVEVTITKSDSIAVSGFSDVIYVAPFNKKGNKINRLDQRPTGNKKGNNLILKRKGNLQSQDNILLHLHKGSEEIVGRRKIELSIKHS
tara:strand:+ start:7385 stop:7675 length:291 start_codon:yes stop_codon:yes gene_type:complete